MRHLPKSFRFFPPFPKFIYTSMVFSSCLALQNALAGEIETTSAPTSIALFPTAPGISASTAIGDLVNAWGDTLVPFMGKPTSFVYLDPQGLYHNGNEYSGSLGSGFRMLTPQAGILGAYVFGDYNHFDNGTEFWFVSPGIERLGDTLDFSFNVYVPVSSQRVNTGTGFASDFGNFQFVNFSGHTEFDEIVNTFVSTGIGYDGEIGYRLPYLPNNTKLYLGGYHFSPKDNDNITGGTARLEVPLSNFVSVSASDAYDNVFHNTFKIGVSFSLWGRSTHFSDHDVATRMVDPIQRDRIAVEGDATTSQYIVEGEANTGVEAVAMSDIWFFAPGGTFVTNPALSDCTAENPCSSNDVNSGFFGGINNLQTGANMFLAPGTYDNINGSLVVNAGQSMYGRTADYTQPATGDNRPLLIGSLDLFGLNTIDSLRLANDPNHVQMQGVLIEDNAVGINIDHTLIGNDGSTPSASYQTGIKIGTGSQVKISNSQINAFSNVDAVNATGIQANGSQNVIKIQSTTISAITNANAAAIGIADVGNQNQWTVIGGQISVDSLMSNSGFTADIYTTGSNSNWNIQSSQLTATSPGNTAGIYSQNGANNFWTIKNDTISAKSTGNGSVYGIFNSLGNFNSWVLMNDTITVKATSSSPEIKGIFEDQGNHDTWTLSDSTLNVANLNNVTSAIFGIDDLNGNADSWQLNNNKIQVSTAADFSTVVGIGNESGQGNSWSLTNNTMTVSNAGNTANSVGIQDFSSQNDSWVLSGNTISTTSSGPSSTSEGIEDNVGVNNSWNLTNNKISVTISGDSTTANSIESLFTTDDVWTLTGNQITATNSGSNSTSTFAVYDYSGSNDSWALTNNQIQVSAAADFSIDGGIDNEFGQGNSWNLTNNKVTVSNSGSTADSFGIRDNSSQTDVWILSNNNISSTNSGLFSTTEGIEDIVGANNSWNLTDNEISTMISGDNTNANAVETLSTVNDIWTLTGNQITDTNSGNGDAFAFAVEDFGGFNDSWTLNNNQISATGTGNGDSEAIGVLDFFDTDNIWTLTGNQISATVTGNTAFAESIDTFGSSNDTWTVTDNIITAQAAQANSWAIGIKDQGSNANTWTLTGNQISATTAGSSSFAVGVAIDSNNANFTMQDNQVLATASGDFSNAIGVSIAGTGNFISSDGDTVTVNASGTGTNAYGFAANGPFDPSSLGTFFNTINIANDQIQVASTQGNAYGLYDPFNITRSNTWNYDLSNTTIQATAPMGLACKVFLESTGCFNFIAPSGWQD